MDIRFAALLFVLCLCVTTSLSKSIPEAAEIDANMEKADRLERAAAATDNARRKRADSNAMIGVDSKDSTGEELSSKRKKRSAGDATSESSDDSSSESSDDSSSDSKDDSSSDTGEESSSERKKRSASDGTTSDSKS
ncbi:clumping factor B-like [Mercenaria mercenaria]|uniref:clumping factor B-like n=1 Tax=Mercenaria mercenaria TaxID=6596 RepID=UPI001E1D62E9|nr:clumping factor B-like [Mercenaria mercenaria]